MRRPLCSISVSSRAIDGTEKNKASAYRVSTPAKNADATGAAPSPTTATRDAVGSNGATSTASRRPSSDPSADPRVARPGTRETILGRVSRQLRRRRIFRFGVETQKSASELRPAVDRNLSNRTQYVSFSSLRRTSVDRSSPIERSLTSWSWTGNRSQGSIACSSLAERRTYSAGRVTSSCASFYSVNEDDAPFVYERDTLGSTSQTPETQRNDRLIADRYAHAHLCL